jgi:Zn/Cd-binding protein ZinT
MKRILSLFIYALLLPLSAQVADKSVTDCNGNTNSIYAVLNSGKVLVVTSSGLDCSICMSAAPAIQAYAAQNSANIEVWGSMTYKSSN